jgi:hypothetical protein
MLWWTSSHFLSIYQISDFYQEFIGEKKSFNLEPIDHSEFNIDFNKEFSWTIFNYKMQSEKMLTSKNRLNLIETPLLVFHAVPLKNKILSSSKAYVYGPGMFVVVCRTKSVNKNSFEKFLFYHELEHVNDNGLINYRSLSRHKMRLAIHTLLLVPFITNLPILIAYILFIGISAINLWLNPIAQRERVADLGALLKIEEVKERIQTINLLNQVFAAQFAKSNPMMKRVIAERMKYLNLFQKDLTTEISNEKMKSLKLQNEFSYQIRDLETVIATLFILTPAFFITINSILIFKVLITTIIVYFVSFWVSIFISKAIYTRISDYFTSKFKMESFFQPFNTPERYNKLSLGEIIKNKYN